MNSHKTACVVILLLIGLMGYGVQKLRARAVTAKEAALSAKTEADQAEQQRKLAEIKLKTIDARTADLRKIYTEWIPHFEPYRNSRVAEQRISDSIREGDVFLLSQRYNYQELDKDDFISHALVADLVVEDDYAKTLNWLGRLEESIPSCRIARCRIIRGDRGNNIALELKLLVPVINRSLASK